MNTITVNNFIGDMEVDFDFTPEYVGSQFEPGYDAEVDVINIRVGGVDVGDLVNSLNGWKRVEEAVLIAWKEQCLEELAESKIYELGKTS